MKLRHVLIAAVTMLLLASLFTSVRCDVPLIDQTVTVTGEDVYSKVFYAELNSSDKVSISITVTGDPIRLGIYNATDGRLYFKQNITSLNEEWTAPYNDIFDFRIDSLVGTSNVHIIVQKVGGGGGFDPLIAVIIVVVVVVVLLAMVLILRMRKQPSVQPPPPPPPLPA